MKKKDNTIFSIIILSVVAILGIFNIIYFYIVCDDVFMYDEYLEQLTPTLDLNSKVNEDILSVYVQPVGPVKNINDYNIKINLVGIKKYLLEIQNNSNYILNKFNNIQNEIDLIIDKSNQWIGFWLSMIGIVITIITILQVYFNYRNNLENKETITRITHELELSSKSNKISSITSCISCLPELFNFTPEDKRQLFSKKFLEILSNEYSNYIIYIRELLKMDNIISLNYNKELDYVYLSWCQILQSIQNIILDYENYITNYQYLILKEILDENINKYHENKINKDNIVECMVSINCALNDFIKSM